MKENRKEQKERERREMKERRLIIKQTPNGLTSSCKLNLRRDLRWVAKPALLLLSLLLLLLLLFLMTEKKMFMLTRR